MSIWLIIEGNKRGINQLIFKSNKILIDRHVEKCNNIDLLININK